MSSPNNMCVFIDQLTEVEHSKFYSDDSSGVAPITISTSSSPDQFDEAEDTSTDGCFTPSPIEDDFTKKVFSFDFAEKLPVAVFPCEQKIMNEIAVNSQFQSQYVTSFADQMDCDACDECSDDDGDDEHDISTQFFDISSAAGFDFALRSLVKKMEKLSFQD